MTAILDIQDLVVDYTSGTRTVRVLDGATLTVEAGESVGVVGESGSGKSTLGLVTGRLLPANAGYTSGSVRVDGRDVLSLEARELRRLRREFLGFIPQDPVAALDPTMRIGKQMALALRGIPNDRQTLIAHLDSVRIREPERVLGLFPHEVSGGMAQRVVVAMTMACKPRLLIADEPTAALDSSVRGEVTKLVFGLAAEAGTTVVWLSHDLRSVGRWCDRVAVMFGGRVVENGPADRVLEHPTHPYTIALAASDPARAIPGERIQTRAMDLGSIAAAMATGELGSDETAGASSRPGVRDRRKTED